MVCYVSLPPFYLLSLCIIQFRFQRVFQIPAIKIKNSTPSAIQSLPLWRREGHLFPQGSTKKQSWTIILWFGFSPYNYMNGIQFNFIWTCNIDIVLTTAQKQTCKIQSFQRQFLHLPRFGLVRWLTLTPKQGIFTIS